MIKYIRYIWINLPQTVSKCAYRSDCGAGHKIPTDLILELLSKKETTRHIWHVYSFIVRPCTHCSCYALLAFVFLFFFSNNLIKSYMPAYIFAVLICIYTVITMKTRCSFTKFKGLLLTFLFLFQWFALKQKMSEVKIVLLHSLDEVSTAEKCTDLFSLLHKHPWIKFIVSSL